MPAGTTNAEMPSSVRAVTVTIEVIGVPELVMNAFAPSMHPVVAVAPGPRARGAGVAAAVGLGEAEGAERSTGDEVGQPSLLLLLGAEAEDRVGAEADAGRQRDAHRLVDPADLLDRDAQRGEVAVAAAPLGREDQAEQAELAHRLHGLERETCARASHSGGVRGDLALGEVADDLAERLVFRRQVEVHHPPRRWGPARKRDRRVRPWFLRVG